MERETDEQNSRKAFDPVSSRPGTTLCCNLGYNLSTYQRSQHVRKQEDARLFSSEKSDGFVVCASIGRIECCTAELMGMIRPYVRVHAVDVHTGRYIRSRKRPPTSPVSTSPYAVRDASDCPVWDQDLLLDAKYSDVVDENALLLFEILDHRPSLNFNKDQGIQGPRPYKQVAWGYVLPIGLCGALNVGAKEDWIGPSTGDQRSRGRTTQSGDDSHRGQEGFGRSGRDRERERDRERGRDMERDRDGGKEMDSADGQEDTGSGDRAGSGARARRRRRRRANTAEEEGKRSDRDKSRGRRRGDGGDGKDDDGSKEREGDETEAEAEADSDKDGDEDEEEDENEGAEGDDGDGEGVRSKLLSRKHKSKGKSTRSKEFCDVDLGSDQESDTGRGAGRGLGVDKHSALDFKRLDWSREQLRQRVQLYSFRLEDGVVGSCQRALMGWPPLRPRPPSRASTATKRFRGHLEAYPDGIPEVYLQWRMLRKKAIRFGVLELVLGPRRSELSAPVAHPIGSPNLLETGGANGGNIGGGEEADSAPRMSRQPSHQSVNEDTVPSAHPYSHIPGLAISKAEAAKIGMAASRRSRAPKEPCVLMEKLLHRLDVGLEGAMVVAFSTCGHLLAVACKSPSANIPFCSDSNSFAPGVTYAVKLYDTDVGALVWTQTYAHHGVIYDMKWSICDTYLLTASSDGTAKIWDVLPLLPEWTKPGSGLRDVIPPGIDQVDERDGINPRSNSNSLTQLLNTDRWPSSHSRIPHLAFTLTAAPPVFVCCGVFQELPPPSGTYAADVLTGFSHMGEVAGPEDGSPPTQSYTLERTPPPRVITGSFDGRLRVWDSGKLKGKIRVDKSDPSRELNPDSFEDDLAPHDGSVNALVIDSRTRYLLSGDSVGEIFIWRTDSTGWYELLRRLKRDVPSTIDSKPVSLRDTMGQSLGRSSLLGGSAAMNRSTTGAVNRSMTGLKAGSVSVGSNGAARAVVERACVRGASGVTTLILHPDKYKSQLLSLTLEPSALKIHNTSTYKIHSVCANSSTAGGRCGSPTDRGEGSSVFCRAGLSADGRMVVCGTNSSNDKGASKLKFWDSHSGSPMPCPLSELMLPYPVRSVSWHPTQHVLAVAMHGAGATVTLYCGQRKSAERTVARISEATVSSTAIAMVRTDSVFNDQDVRSSRAFNPMTASTDSIAFGAMRARTEAARLKGFAMGSGSGFDTRQSTDFYHPSPARLDARGMDRGGGGGGGDFEGMRMSMDGRLMVGTEKENIHSGSGNGRTDLPVVSESIRNLRTEKAREILDKIRAAKGQ